MILTKGSSLSLDFVEIQDIQIIQKDVTEEISHKNIKNFLITIANSYTIDINNFNILYTYSPKSKIYHIYVLKKSKIKNRNIPLPYIFKVLYHLNELDSNSSDLFVTKDFFVLFINGELVCFKQINEISTNDDIKEYIEKYIDINIDNTYDISLDYLEDIKIKYITNYKYIKPLDTLAFKSKYKYIIYTFLLLSLSVYWLYNNNINKDITIDKNIANKKVIAPIKESKIILPVIQAVIDKSILIDNKWIQSGDRYKKFIVLDVTLEYVELEYKNTIYRIKNDR